MPDESHVSDPGPRRRVRLGFHAAVVRLAKMAGQTRTEFSSVSSGRGGNSHATEGSQVYTAPPTGSFWADPHHMLLGATRDSISRVLTTGNRIKTSTGALTIPRQACMFRANMRGDAEAIAALLAAGRKASAAGAAESALDHFRNAKRLAGDSVTAEMSQLLAEALLKAGRLTEVPAVLEPLLEQPGIPATEYAMALRLSGVTHGLAGNFELATLKLLAAADAFESTDPAQTAAAVYMGLSLCMLFQGPFQAAPFAERAASLRARGLPGDALASDIDAVAGCAAVLSGDPAGWRLLTSARATAQTATATHRIAGVDLTQRVGLPYMLCRDVPGAL